MSLSQTRPTARRSWARCLARSSTRSKRRRGRMKATDAFVDQTEGLLLVDMTAIAQLARTEHFAFDDRGRGATIQGRRNGRSVAHDQPQQNPWGRRLREAPGKRPNPRRHPHAGYRQARGHRNRRPHGADDHAESHSLPVRPGSARRSSQRRSPACCSATRARTSVSTCPSSVRSTQTNVSLGRRRAISGTTSAAS